MLSIYIRKYIKIQSILKYKQCFEIFFEILVLVLDFYFQMCNFCDP